MTPDIEKYRKYVDKFDMPETEKIELINTVWKVMEGFTDRAFGLNSAQHAIATQVKQRAVLDAPVLQLKATRKTTKSIKPAFSKRTHGLEEG